jgi:hypothetical protein
MIVVKPRKKPAPRRQAVKRAARKVKPRPRHRAPSTGSIPLTVSIARGVLRIEIAARALVGDGCGIRKGLEEAERAVLERAIEIVWRKAYDFALDDSARFNMGMRTR